MQLERDVIILSASSSGRNFHVAGVDRSTGKWIRVQSKYSRIGGAIPFDQLVYNDFSAVRLFDVARINFLERAEIFEQPERILFDSSYQWKRLEHLDLSDVISLRGFDEREFVFFNSDRALYREDIREPRESLLLLFVTDINVAVRQTYRKKHITLRFEYNGRKYFDFSIGDLRVRNFYMKKPPGLHRFADEAAIVFSLSEKYHDGRYYKVAAQLLRWS